MANFKIPGVIGVYDHENKICRPSNFLDLMPPQDGTSFAYLTNRGPIGISIDNEVSKSQQNSETKPEYKVDKGAIISDKIKVQISSSIEHLILSIVKAIVLHRTDGSSASGTLGAYKNGQKTGAHFLIGEDGKIYQTAKMNKICWHVGKIKARCKEENKCTIAEKKKIDTLLYEKNLTYSGRIKNVSNHEAKKKYPERYPNNSDSIGIEVVGRYIGTSKSFKEVTGKQKKSLKWLVAILAKIHSLSIGNDTYSHGTISYKMVSEGAQLLSILKGN